MKLISLSCTNTACFSQSSWRQRDRAARGPPWGLLGFGHAPCYPSSFQEKSLARTSFPLCQASLRICCLAGLWGEGKGTAALCWGSTTWMKHAWKIPNHRPAVSCSKIKGIFYESNTFQCCTCESGDEQHAHECLLCLSPSFCICRIKCLLISA